MMAWSVTFHSWLTLVLLVWACILWLVKDRSWGTLVCSRFITFYAMMLICLQFLYSLNLTEEELPTSAVHGTINLLSFGIKHHYENNPGLLLGVQILYTSIFWLVLHQYIYIRRTRSQIGHVEEKDCRLVKAFLYIKEKLSKYWLLAVFSYLLAMCVEGKPSGIKMIYALFFTLNGFVFELSWEIWQRTLSSFLCVIVFYTMIVVLLVYTFQFDEVSGIWRKATGFSNDQLADLGLIKYDRPRLVCIPTFFLLAVFLQKHYFQDRFLKLIKKRVRSGSDLNNVDDGEGNSDAIEMQEFVCSPQEKKPDSPSVEDQALQYAKKGGELFLERWYVLVRYAWRMLEFHMWKILIITVLVSAVQKATAVYGLLFVTWVIFILVKSHNSHKWVLCTMSMTSAYVGIVILGSMFYQLDFLNTLRGSALFYNCTIGSGNETSVETYDFIEWLGFSKMEGITTSFFYHAQGYITIVIMLALERIVTRRQDWCRFYRGELKLDSQLTILYPSVTNDVVDNDFFALCKYFSNYWFYKFGVEACYIMAVITIWTRADSFGVIYSILFIIAMALRTRKSLARYWKFYTIILLVILIGEYAIALGMPPMWCTDNEYPWTTLPHTTIEIRNRLIRWLYLPDYTVEPHSRSLVVDVFQLIFVSCQLFVFEFETTGKALSHGGDNKYLTPKQLDEVTPATNSKPNFMLGKSREILDQLKTVVFKYSFWITCAIIFIAGTSRISLFCIGYLFAFFYLLWFNESLLMGKPSHLLKVWNRVLGYNVAGIMLQITSCVYIDILEERACIFVQLFSLVCSRPDSYQGVADQLAQETCEMPDFYNDSGLTWDFVCFLFLIIQRRIFQTYYFLHVSEDRRISMELASRGAKLFEEKLIQEVNSRKENEETEESSVERIRKNMESIKKNYADIGKGELVPRTHIEAMRSGDYYMFEDETSSEEKDVSNPFQILHAADTVGIDRALEEREENKKLLETGDDNKPIPKETLRGKSTEDLAQVETDGEKIDTKQRNVGFFLYAIDTFIVWLNTINCNYRNVALQLSSEKDDLAKKNIAQSPRNSSTEIMIDPVENVDQTRSEVLEENDELQTQSSLLTTSQKTKLEPIDFDKDQMRILRLFYAIWYTIISRTDVVCYLLVILNLTLTASIMSLVLPVLIFLWSTFSVPRPTSGFWNFCIGYLGIVIWIKFLFQFEFFPWNHDTVANLHVNNPFWLPRIIGIEQKERWSALDLAQLLAFFFHRDILKVHGLWNKNKKDDARVSCEEDTGSKTEKIKSSSKGEHSTDIVEGQAKGKVHDLENTKTETKASESESSKKVFTSLCGFCHLILNEEFSTVTDVYIYIFLCDFINFVISIIGYWSIGRFTTEAADVVLSISSNKVPTGFLVMLLIQLVMIFIDRVIYLRKALKLKIIYQIVLVIGVHVLMFFVLPAINKRPFYKNGYAQAWYFFKAVYFLLSAHQIRCGYTTRIFSNFLTKSYGIDTLFLFKVYRLIPFLAELAAVIDWICIKTTMGIGEWFKFHSIYAEVFELKCWRVFEKNHSSPRTEPKSKHFKRVFGGLLVVFLVVIILSPLAFMNVVLTIVGLTNNPVQVSVQVTVGTFEPLFQVIADSDAITVWDKNKFNSFAKRHADDPSAADFLSSFTASQVVSVVINGESKTVWAISPPQQQLLIDRLSPTNRKPVLINFEWKLIRNSEKTSVVTTTGNNQISLRQNSTARAQLHELLSTPDTISTPATVKELFPKYIHAEEKSVSTPAKRLYATSDSSEKFVDTNLSIRYAATNNLTSWWRVVEVTPGDANATSPQLELVVFSDKVSPVELSFLVNFGIVGLYVSVVLVVGKLVRGALIGSTNDIMFQELPRVDRVLQLCLDLHLVREKEEFQLEEDLYAKLIFLYRSPHTIIQWTRTKQKLRENKIKQKLRENKIKVL